MHAARKEISPGRSRALDKVSNGTRMLAHVDMRSAAGRRFRHLVDAYSAELGTELSEAELSLVRQACALQLQAERMQGAIVRGEVVDSDALIRISSTSKRLLGIIAGKAGKRTEPQGQDLLRDYLATSNFQVPDAGDDAEHEAETDVEHALEPESTPIP
jgi:hypothetical protein